MRLIRRLVLLTVVCVGGVAAYNYVSENGWPVRPRAAALEAKIAKAEATKLATKAAAEASHAATRLGGTVSDSALTAKIKSKMALDDHVEARDINIDTSATIVTLTGIVKSNDERDRAVRLASDTEGVTKVVDRMQVRKS